MHCGCPQICHDHWSKNNASWDHVYHHAKVAQRVDKKGIFTLCMTIIRAMAYSRGSELRNVAKPASPDTISMLIPGLFGFWGVQTQIRPEEMN
jgi:hypothetical protein